MQPYALEREFEDLQAVMDEAGGPAHLYGASTGGALVLEAAAAGMAAGKLAVYEVPYNLAPEWPILWREYVAKMRLALARDGRGDAIDLFLRVTGSAESDIASAHTSPFWPALKSLAHTLAYDAACLGDGWPPTDRLAKISQPTLVLTGDEPPANAAGWIRALDAAADAIVASIPKGQRQTVRGQGHIVNPTTFAPVLVQFFGIEDGSPLHANLSR
jgi:pimeloyl-ACP methyl ester carboxylesterase